MSAAERVATIVGFLAIVGGLIVAATWAVFFSPTPRIRRAVDDVLEPPDLPDDDVDVAARLAPFTALRLGTTVTVHSFVDGDCPGCSIHRAEP